MVFVFCVELRHLEGGGEGAGFWDVAFVAETRTISKGQGWGGGTEGFRAGWGLNERHIRLCCDMYAPEATLLAVSHGPPFRATGRPRLWGRGPGVVGGLDTASRVRKGRDLRLAPTRPSACPTLLPRPSAA